MTRRQGEKDKLFLTEAELYRRMGIDRKIASDPFCMVPREA